MPPAGRPRFFRPRHRQTTLNFAPVQHVPPKSTTSHSPPPHPEPHSPPKRSNIEVVIFTPQKQRKENSQALPLGLSPPSARKRAASVHRDSGSESDVVLTSARKRRRSNLQSKQNDQTPFSDDEILPTLTLRKRSAIPLSDNDGDDDGDEEDEDLITPRPRRTRKPLDPASDDDSDLPRSRRRRRSTVKSICSEPDDFDEPDIPALSATRSTRKPRPPSSSTKPFASLDGDSSENSDLEIIRPRRKNSLQSGEEEDSGIDDDIELASKTPTLQSRLRAPPKQTPYQLSLLRLQAKRAGLPPTSPSQASPASSSPEQNYDSDSSNLSFIDDDDTNDGQSSSQHLLGAPDLPLQFSTLSHQPPLTNFLLVCTHLSLSLLIPDLVAIEHPDEVIQMAQQRLEGMVATYANSILTSSVWRPEVLRALKAYPEEEVRETAAVSERCEVCGRDRLATWVVGFAGKRYDAVTLRDVGEDDDSKGDEETQHASTSTSTNDNGNYDNDESIVDVDDDYAASPLALDSTLNPIPPPTTSWAAGSTCATRLKLAHAFFHWRKHLYEFVKNELYIREYITYRGRPTGKICGETLSDDERYNEAVKITESLKKEFEGCYGLFSKALENAEKSMTHQGRGGRGDVKWVGLGLR